MALYSVVSVTEQGTANAQMSRAVEAVPVNPILHGQCFLAFMANPQWMYFSRALYSSLTEENSYHRYHCPLVQHKFCINCKYIFVVNHHITVLIRGLRTHKQITDSLCKDYVFAADDSFP